jgi:transcriptional regulator with XRE-family HTH domain
MVYLVDLRCVVVLSGRGIPGTERDRQRMTQKSLADRLRLLRAQRGLTVKDAAQQVGVDRRTLRRIELGTQGAQYPTLAKIADGYGVPVQELLEEPVGAGKAEAPEAGPADRRSEVRVTGHLDSDDPFEEERQVIPQSADALRGFIKDMKGFKELREAQIEEIKTGTEPHERALLIQMEMADKGFRALLEGEGALGFAEAVKARHEMAHPEVLPLCHELLRRFEELEKLSDEARVSGFAASSDIHEEAVKGVSRLESWKQEGSERSEH